MKKLLRCEITLVTVVQRGSESADWAEQSNQRKNKVSESSKILRFEGLEKINIDEKVRTYRQDEKSHGDWWWLHDARWTTCRNSLR